MPNKKILNEKMQIVKELADEFKSAQSLLVADYRGLTVQQDTDLRNALRKEKVTYKVVKNSLAAFAAKEAGIEGMDSLFVGPTAIAYSTTDVIAPAKVLQQYADKIEAFSIKGGALENKLLSAVDVKALASIPPKEVLYAQIVCAIASPISGLVMILNAIREKGEEAGVQTFASLASAPAAE
ncbi:MAG: 50S ribosomal protein L10 [Saccharofermentanales bacterium]